MPSFKIISAYVMHELKFPKYKHSYLKCLYQVCYVSKVFYIKKEGDGKENGPWIYIKWDLL